MEIKVCTKCKNGLPANTKFFCRNKHGKFGLRGTCKKCYKSYSDMYYINNKEKVLRNNKRFDVNNPDYKKQWYIDNVEHVRNYSREYYRSNVVAIKQHYREHREFYLKRQKQYYFANRKKRLDYNKQYYRTNNGIISRRRSGNIHYKNNKLSRCMSSSIYKALKLNKNGLCWKNFVCYSLRKLTLHLQRSIGLTDKVILDEFWSHFYGTYYHVDHIIPIAFFDKKKLQNPNSFEFKKCWSLKNLQLLPCNENLRKSAKLNYIKGGFTFK